MRWYKTFRAATYSSLFGSLIWTILLVLPFRPFSYLLPIVARGGPGTWFLLAYVLYLVIGLAGFGMLSSLLYIIEIHEQRVINQATMMVGFILLSVGMILSCVLLAVAGALGGYALNINNETESAAEGILSFYVLPITTTALVTVLGAALSVISMIRAKTLRPETR